MSLLHTALAAAFVAASGLPAAAAPAAPPALQAPPATGPAAGPPAAPGANVVPQIRVPLGRTPPPPASAASGADVPALAASSPGGIDDAVARCRAQKTRLARQECMDRAGRASAPR